ncbi:MAG: cation:proton antiporter [Halanaerobiaceae bacterium]
MAELMEIENAEKWLLTQQAGNKQIYVFAFLMLVALVVVIIAKKYRIPLVAGYVFTGVLISVDVVGRLPFLSAEIKEWYSFTITNSQYISDIALAFIAFTVGSELSMKMISRMKKLLLYIVPVETFMVFILVTVAVTVAGQSLYVALMLGGIAAATAPAATVMVLKEYNAEGPLTSTIMATVGLGDALAIIIFSIVKSIAFIHFSGAADYSVLTTIFGPLLEIAGSLGLGLGLGYLAQKYLVEMERKTKKLLLLITTVVGVYTLALVFALSPLIANMGVGFVFRNFARRNPGIAGYLETITVPLYALFFILAGTKIKFGMLSSAGFILVTFLYLFARITGKIAGTSLGARLAGAPEKIRRYAGLGLFPQSDVAIALAYTVQRQFVSVPEVGSLIFNILLFSAAVTEVFGPFATRYAIFRAGEANPN